MVKTKYLHALAVALIGLSVTACSDDDAATTSGSGGSGSGGSPTGAGAGGTGGDAATGGAGGMGGDGPGICEILDMPAEAMLASSETAAGDPPAPTGGTLADGIYVLLGVTVYNGAASPDMSRTALELSAGGTLFRRRNIREDGSDETVCGTVDLDGTTYIQEILATQIGPVNQEQIREFGYDATATTLDLHFEPNDTDQINVVHYGLVD